MELQVKGRSCTWLSLNVCVEWTQGGKYFSILITLWSTIKSRVSFKLSNDSWHGFVIGKARKSHVNSRSTPGLGGKQGWRFRADTPPACGLRWALNGEDWASSVAGDRKPSDRGGIAYNTWVEPASLQGLEWTTVRSRAHVPLSRLYSMVPTMPFYLLPLKLPHASPLLCFSPVSWAGVIVRAMICSDATHPTSRASTLRASEDHALLAWDWVVEETKSRCADNENILIIALRLAVLRRPPPPSACKGCVNVGLKAVRFCPAGYVLIVS